MSRYDNPLVPDWFAFPDLADFPDYKNENRNTDIVDLSHMENAVYGNNYKQFEIELKKITNIKAPWMDKLSGAFKAYLSYRPRSSIDGLNEGSIDLFETGIHVTQIDTSKINVKSEVDKLLNQPDKQVMPGTYDRGTFLNDHYKAELTKQFTNAGIFAAVKLYSGKVRKITNVFLHVSVPTDTHYKQFFMDATTTPRFTNLHIDPKQDVMKAIVYLEDTHAINGAFGVVPKSNRFIYPILQEIFGRTITTGNYCKTPEERKSVFALPKHLRVSYNFGRCVLDGSKLDIALGDHFKHITTDEGNVSVFDAGTVMHQGGIVHEGRRVSLQVLMK